MAVALGLVGYSKISKKYQVGEAFTAPTSPEALARGKYLLTSTTGCLGCHADGAGQYFFHNEMPFGALAAPNLTTGQGGLGGAMTDSDLERAIRHGIGHDGRVLVIMPSSSFTHMSDEDLGAVIAYLRTLPPANNELEPRNFAPPAYVLLGSGLVGDLPAAAIDQTAQHPATVAHGVTAEYGQYLVTLATCADCHGPNLTGASGGPGPGAPNISPSGEVGQWTQEQFINTIRTGITPSGRQLTEDMPWKQFGTMVDEDLQAIYTYLHTLPAT